MSDLRKALKVALKGFEKIHEGCGFVKENAKLKDDKNVRDLATEVRKDCNKYIEILRQALAQPDEVLAEREACAKVCDEIESEAYGKHRQKYDPYDEGVAAGALACVEAIRARGDK